MPLINYGHSHEIYSTDEFPTGAVWVDKKPVYRRTFRATSTLAGGVNHTLGAIPGADSLVSIRGAWRTGDSWQKPVNYFVNSSDFSWCQLSPDGVVIFHGASDAARLCVTVEYTKQQEAL